MNAPESRPDADLGLARVEHLFPSPVMHFDWPDGEALNAGLREAVQAHRRTSLGVVKTNRGGWQSDTDLQDWPEPAAQELMRRVLRLVREYLARQGGGSDPVFDSGWRIRAWANVNEHGHFNRTHDHLGVHSFISGVYYVNVGDIESGQVGGGRTRFEDWTRVAVDTSRDADTERRDFYMTPRNGRMVLFPAALMHSVEPYLGHAQRITIAYNLYHPALGVPRLAPFLEQADWWWTNFRGLVILKRKLPEKLHALALLPRCLAAQKGSLGMAWAQATAQASEEFEARRAAA